MGLIAVPVEDASTPANTVEMDHEDDEEQDEVGMDGAPRRLSPSPSPSISSSTTSSSALLLSPSTASVNSSYAPPNKRVKKENPPGRSEKQNKNPKTRRKMAQSKRGARTAASTDESGAEQVPPLLDDLAVTVGRIQQHAVSVRAFAIYDHQL